MEQLIQEASFHTERKTDPRKNSSSYEQNADIWHYQSEPFNNMHIPVFSILSGNLNFCHSLIYCKSLPLQELG